MSDCEGSSGCCGGGEGGGGERCCDEGSLYWDLFTNGAVRTLDVGIAKYMCS